MMNELKELTGAVSNGEADVSELKENETFVHETADDVGDGSHAADDVKSDAGEEVENVAVEGITEQEEFLEENEVHEETAGADETGSADNQKPKKSKKGLIAGLLALALAGGGGYYAYDQAKRTEANQAAVDSLSLSVVKDTLDYADADPVNTLTLIKSNGDVSADIETIDVRNVGKTKVIYTVDTLDSYGAVASKTFEQEFEVVDTAAPVIELSEEKVSFYTGSSFAASDYIISVKDPVDGDLAVVEADAEKPKDKGWYTITSDVATDTAGNYTVKIHAEDKNGNKSDKEFAVTISEKPVAATPTYNNTYSNTTNTYAATNNYSGYSGGGGYVDSTPASSYSEPAAPATPACASSPVYQGSGGVNIADYTIYPSQAASGAAAEAWCDAHIYEDFWSGYGGGQVVDSCTGAVLGYYWFWY